MRSAPLGYFALAAAGTGIWLLAQDAPGISIVFSLCVLAVLGFYIAYSLTGSSAHRASRTARPRGMWAPSPMINPTPPPPSTVTPNSASAATRVTPVNIPPSAQPSSVGNSGVPGLIDGRYHCVRMLGEGGMKRVYVAEDLKLNSRLCAVAELLDSSTDPAQQQANRSAFEREADLLAELSNDHIPKIFDRFSDGAHHYLVMEYVPGETLEKWVASRGGRIDQAAALDFGTQILEGLVYLHSRTPPIAYRDLKPDNVIITPEHRVRLIDFGIARHFTHANVTRVGTSGYAAPEQYQGHVDPRTDIFAFGAVMHRVLSGRDPQNEPPFTFPPLASMRPDMDAHLAQLIDRCLNFDPGKRPQTSAEVLAAVKTIAPMASARPANRRPPSKPRVRFCTQCGAQLPSRGKCPNCGAVRYAN